MTGYRERFALDGRVAVVTGGCGLIGREIAAALAEFGAAVAVVDLDAADCRALAAELHATYGTPSLGVAADVSDPGQVGAMVREVALTLGQVRILANNAATKTDDLDAFLRPAEDYDLDTWRKVAAVALDGLFLVAQAVGRHMIDHGNGGSIVQTGSIYGVLAPDDRIYEGSQYNGRPISTPPVYAAVKAGVVGLSRYLAARWARHGIRVNTLSPGGVESGQNQAFVDRYSARVPLKRMARPDDVAGAFLFLASDASAYLTGQNLVVDGGLSAW